MTRPTDPKNITSGEETLVISGFSVEEQVQESIYIARLFQRLLSEYRYLKATRLQFVTGQDTLRAVLFADESELKSWSLKNTWFHPLLRWLSARISPLHESSAAKPDEFFCAVRVQAEVLEFHSRVVRVAGKEKELTLDGCILHTPSEYLRACGCAERLAIDLDGLLSAQRGLITLAAPSAGQSLKVLAFILGLSQSHLVSDPSLSGLKKLLADKVLLVETAVGNDSIEILFERASYVRELGEHYLGGICGGFARRVCESCAREVRADEGQSSQIPEDLRTRIPETYLRGSGCAVCGHTGYRGQVFLGSLALVDTQVR